MHSPDREALRWRGDDLLDGPVAAMVARGEHARLDAAVRQGDTVPALLAADLPPEIIAALHHASRVPSDPDRLDRARALFARHDLTFSLAMILGSSLVVCADTDSAEVLAATGRVEATGDRIETLLGLLHALTDEGGLAPGGPGRAALLRVRLQIAATRARLRRAGWDRERHGEPVSQRVLLVWGLALGTETLHAVQRLGIVVQPAEADAWLHLARVAATLLGAPTEHLPEEGLEARVRASQVLGPRCAWSPGGAALARALVELASDPFPAPFSEIIPAFCRRAAGDPVCDALGLAGSTWQLEGQGPGVLAAVRGSSKRVDDVVRRLVEGLIGRASLGWARRSPPVLHVPEALARAWHLPPVGDAGAISALIPSLVDAVRACFPPYLEDEAERLAFELTVVIAAADGVVDDLERRVLGDALATIARSPLGPDEAAARIDEVLTEIREVGVEGVADRIGAVLIGKDAVPAGLQLAVAVAYADEGLDPRERRVVDRLARAAGVEPDAVDDLVAVVRARLQG